LASQSLKPLNKTHFKFQQKLHFNDDEIENAHFNSSVKNLKFSKVNHIPEPANTVDISR
jgi:hypothetical protein